MSSINVTRLSPVPTAYAPKPGRRQTAYSTCRTPMLLSRQCSKASFAFGQAKGAGLCRSLNLPWSAAPSEPPGRKIHQQPIQERIIIMRKRNHAVTIRMTEKEYAAMQKRIKESGRTQQAYIINSALNAQISSAEEISTLKEVSASFADLVRQLRGIATNINQMTRIANSVGIIPSSRELSKISDQIAEYRKESENEWQSIRSLTAGQKPTQG